MSFLKNKWILLVLNLIVSILLFAVFAPQYNLMHFINISFYVTGIYCFLFVFLFIINGRFFDGLLFGLRRFSLRKSKQQDHLNELEEKRLPSEMINQTFYKLIGFQGLVLLILQILLLTFYYVS